MAKILVCDPIHQDGLDILRESGHQVNVRPDMSNHELVELADRYHAILCRSRTIVDKNVIERGRSLVVIARAGVGLDNIDVSYAENRGVTVVNAPDALSNAVAEFTLGLCLALIRGIALGDSYMKRDKWIKKRLIGRELKCMTMGIVGFGRIGRMIGDKAMALGMKLIVYDPLIEIGKEHRERGVVQLENLEDLLAEADVVSLHLPLNDETHHMINEERLSKMKSTAYLINTSRGGIVDSQALRRALKEGWIAGAALDVFEVEPSIGDELVRSEKVVATPHIGGQSIEAQREASVVAARKLLKVLKEKV